MCLRSSRRRGLPAAVKPVVTTFFFFVGGDSWPESESAESESVPDRFLAALEDADEDDADEPKEEDGDDEPDEEVDEDDNVLWMVVGDGTGDGSVAALSWTSC